MSFFQATVQVSEAKSNSVNTCRLKSVDVLLMANKFTEIQLDVGKEVRMETLTINEILKTGKVSKCLCAYVYERDGSFCVCVSLLVLACVCV